MELTKEEAGKLLDEISIWANKHGVLFTATEVLLDECPTLKSLVKTTAYPEKE